MNDRERLSRLIVERSIEMGDFVLSSGATSRYYVDCRRTTMHAEGQVLAGSLCHDLLRDSGLKPDVVGGLTMGADPLAYAIAYTSWLRGDPVNAFSVRKSTKVHGAGRRIEGCFAAGQRVVVIEDVITSGGSALEACAAVEAEGGKVIAVLALVDRESGGRAAIEARGYPVVSLFGIGELLQEAGAGSVSG